MCFKDIIPSLPQFQIHFPLPTGPSLCPFCFHSSSPICAAHIFFGVWSSTGMWSTYQGLHSLKKKKKTCFSLFQTLTIVPQLGVGLCAQLPSPDFVHIVTPLWVHMYSYPHCVGKTLFAVHPHLWFSHSFYLLFQNNPWALGGEGMTYMSHTRDEHSTASYSMYTGPIVSLYVSYHLLPIKAFLMRLERCIYSWV